MGNFISRAFAWPNRRGDYCVLYRFKVFNTPCYGHTELQKGVEPSCLYTSDWYCANSELDAHKKGLDYCVSHYPDIIGLTPNFKLTLDHGAFRPLTVNLTDIFNNGR